MLFRSKTDAWDKAQFWADWRIAADLSVAGNGQLERAITLRVRQSISLVNGDISALEMPVITSVGFANSYAEGMRPSVQGALWSWFPVSSCERVAAYVSSHMGSAVRGSLSSEAVQRVTASARYYQPPGTSLSDILTLMTRADLSSCFGIVYRDWCDSLPLACEEDTKIGGPDDDIPEVQGA